MPTIAGLDLLPLPCTSSFLLSSPSLAPQASLFGCHRNPRHGRPALPSSALPPFCTRSSRESNRSVFPRPSPTYSPARFAQSPSSRATSCPDTSSPSPPTSCSGSASSMLPASATAQMQAPSLVDYVVTSYKWVALLCFVTWVTPTAQLDRPQNLGTQGRLRRSPFAKYHAR